MRSSINNAMRKLKQHSPKQSIKPILEIASSVGLTEDDLEFFGRYKAKVRLEAIKRFPRRKHSSLILVSAMTPTPAGDGKTTVSIGLAQALARIGKSTVAALREPSRAGVRN